MFAHIDADAFFAAVLCRKNPRLRGKPLLAMGMGGGCVISASYEAKAKGVKTGMRLKDALALVPNAIHLPSDFAETGIASAQIESVLQSTCPDIEAMSIDEWFLDITTVPGGIPVDLDAFAKDLRERVTTVTGISVSVGIAPTKLLAKMASEYRKPAGITVVHHQKVNDWSLTIESFLRDRPAAAIPGVGRRRMKHVTDHGWTTAWDITQAHPQTLKQLFGRPGMDMQRELLGEALSQVVTDPAPPKSVSRARSFPALGDTALLWAHTLRHLEYITLKMRRHGLSARGISLWLRDNRYDYHGTHISLPRAMDTEEALQPYIRTCFLRLWDRNKKYTQVGACLWRLQPQSGMQLSLFESVQKVVEAEELQTSLDKLHSRFGRDSITKGSAMKAKSGWKPHMELSLYGE